MEKLDEIVHKVEGKAEQSLTVLWNALLPWQQDNQYIRSGYRPASGSYWHSAASLGYLHNETVNIYTHLVGALVFAATSGILWSTLQSRYEAASTEDVYVFGCFFGGAIACLSLSASFHTMSNHSHEVASSMNKLDYLGIILLIWGSFIPSIYYGFSCEPKLITTYWSMVTSLGAGCAVISCISRFRTPTWRPFRAGMFIALGLSAVIPVIDGLRRYGLSPMVDLISLPWLVSQGLFYIFGALLYGVSIPRE